MYGIFDMDGLQSDDNAEKFITHKNINDFESLAKFMKDREQKYQELGVVHISKVLTKTKCDKEYKDIPSKYPKLKEHMLSL